MEHVIRYRILGHHPAASGKYHNTGFSGESLPVRQLLDEVVREHQINLSAFKTVITLVIPNNNSNVGGEQGGGTTTSKVLYPDDLLHNYDSIDITVSKRSLTDDAEAAEDERRAQAQHRLKDAEEELQFLVNDPHMAATTASLVVAASDLADDVAGNALPLRGQLQGHKGKGGAKGSASGVAAAASSVDALALQRAMALASKFFPIREGQSSSLTSLEDAAPDHVCVLCELSPFHELLTPCCHFPVCKTCLESGQAMMVKEQDCPVCGRNMKAASSRNKRRQLQQQAYPQQSPSATPGPETKEGIVLAAASEGSGGTKRSYGEISGQEGTSEKDHKRARLSAQARDADAGPGKAHGTSVHSKSGHTVSSLARDDKRALSAAVVRMEAELRDSLDRTLSCLAAADPLTAEMKARRVKSAALAAMDRLA